MFLKSTNFIYLIYPDYPAIPKNKSLKTVFDNDDMSPSAQNAISSSFLKSQPIHLFLYNASPTSPLKTPWVIPLPIYSLVTPSSAFNVIFIGLHFSLMISS
jgi:hypothetical protein